jgi:rSAM/selenodomain-associated transferase 2
MAGEHSPFEHSQWDGWSGQRLMITDLGKINQPSPAHRSQFGGVSNSTPKISIVIPILNEAITLDAFLRNLSQQQRKFEIILADGGSTDGTLEVLNRFPGVKLIRSGGGRGRQMNEGAREARGEILLFLHADTILLENALRKIEEALADSSVAAGSFSLEFDHPGRFFRILSIFGRINHPFFTYGDQGLFLRASTFRRIGGFKEIPVMEDVEIQERLRKIGAFIKLKEPVFTSVRRYLRNGPLRQHLITTGVVLLYHLGVSPLFLGRQYYRNHRQGESR